MCHVVFLVWLIVLCVLLFVCVLVGMIVSCVMLSVCCACLGDHFVCRLRCLFHRRAFFRVLPCAWQWSSLRIECDTPVGVGRGFTVTVKVSQLCNTIGCASDASQHADASAPFTVSYDPPVVTSISPNHGPTLGEYNVTLTGFSFGATGAAVVLSTIYSSKPAPLTLAVVQQNHTHVVVVMQAATGTALAMSVTVGGQTTVVPGAWSYDPPVIYEVQPLDKRNESLRVACDADDVPCVANWIAAPASDISVIGKNFGPDATYAALAPIVIMVGNFSCVARAGTLSVYVDDGR